jgi:MOSC domain-containing protein YiiM
MNKTINILAICAGKAKPLTGINHPDYASVLSGIDKKPLSTLSEVLPVSIGMLGIDGDEQADLEVHGGLEKAVYAYPSEHYKFWKEVYQNEVKQTPTWQAGQFGENLLIEGVLENEVFVGDQWRIGEVELAVVKMREPCFKFNAKMGFSSASKRMVESGRSGWYLRVIKPGQIKAGDAIQIIPGKQEISIQEQNERLLKKRG